MGKYFKLSHHEIDLVNYYDLKRHIMRLDPAKAFHNSIHERININYAFSQLSKKRLERSTEQIEIEADMDTRTSIIKKHF
jgi:hypothetical protein